MKNQDSTREDSIREVIKEHLSLCTSGWNYMFIRNPEDYICKTSGIQSKDIIEYVEGREDIFDYDAPKAIELAKAITREPPVPERELMELEERLKDEYNPKMKHHLDECETCRWFTDMYKGYRSWFKHKDEELQREINNPTPGLEKFIELWKEARDAMKFYKNFDEYWEHVKALRIQH